MYSDLLQALPNVLEWTNFAAVIIGVISGIVVGAMPGLSATMAISVLVPFTFGLEPLVALGLMAGIYNGAMYGGAIPAVLLRIPGTPAAVATTFDGYPMAQKGEGGFALQVAVISSAIGGIASAFALMLLAPSFVQGDATLWSFRSVLGCGLWSCLNYFLAGRQPCQGLDFGLFWRVRFGHRV